MASNRVIFAASLLYSLFLVLSSCSYEPFSIFELIRTITHLTATNNEETPKDYNNFSLIYSNVMKWAFVYSIAMVFLSSTMAIVSFSSFRHLIAAISRHWKPFLASIVAAIIFPAMLRPPSMADPLFGTYFTLTLFHALFVVYLSVKFVTMPMLEEKFGKDTEVPNDFAKKFVFWQISMSVMQIMTLYLSKKEAYKMQVVFGVVSEVMHMIWLASCYELMVFSVLIYENKNNKKQLAEAGISSLRHNKSSALLVDESLP